MRCATGGTHPNFVVYNTQSCNNEVAVTRYITNQLTGTEAANMTDLCLRDALELLKNQGHTNTTATRVHHAILAGHISRPEMDGSHRYRFSRRNLNELR